MGLGVDEAGGEQGVECLPEIRAGDLGLVGVDELEVLDQKLDVGEPAGAALEVVRPA